MGLLTGLVRSPLTLFKSSKRSRTSSESNAPCGNWSNNSVERLPIEATNLKQPTQYLSLPTGADLSRLHLQNTEPMEIEHVPEQVACLTSDMLEVLETVKELQDRIEDLEETCRRMNPPLL